MKKFFQSAFVFIMLLSIIIFQACSGGGNVLPGNEYLWARKPDNWEKIVQNSPYYLGERELAEEKYEDGSFSFYYRRDYGNYPCIDGSTALIPAVWEVFWQLLPGCSVYTAYDSSLDVFADGLCRFSTTHDAYINLIDKKPVTRIVCNEDEDIKMTKLTKAPDVLLASAPSQEELDYAAGKGIGLIVNAVNYDAFVFITHKNNPVDSLTVQQVQDIYSGKITNWKKVGGKNQKITAYQRAANSGSQTGMEQLVMKDVPLMKPPTKLVIDPMSGLIDVVADYKNKGNSIGYTYKYYLNNLYTNENVKILKINGAEPDGENIRTRAYPFVASGNAVIREEDLDGTGGIFMRWLMSGEGQECIAQAGYITAY